MRLKKLNAVTALAVIISLIGHIGVMTYSLWTGWYNYIICKTFPHIAIALMIVHVLLSIIIFFFYNDGSEVKYKNLNIGTVLQRATAIIIMILIHFHMKAYAHVVTGEVLSAGMTAFRIVTELLFFSAVLVHIAVSFGKAFITLGIGSSGKAIQNITRIAFVICAVILLAAGSGAVVFYLKGIM